MAKFQDRFCFGIKRESSFYSAAVPKDKSDRIHINLQREKTAAPEKSVYSIQREPSSVRGEKLNLNYPREKVFQVTQQRKTIKFQKLNGWNTPDIGEGVVEWVKTQLLIQGKKDRKLRLSSEDLVFRYVPKRRCPGLQNIDEFEKDSLHPNFFQEKEKDQKAKKKREKSSVKNNESSDASSVDYKRRLLRSRSKDDMGIIPGPKKLEESLDKYCPPKRSKSVICDLNNAWINPSDTSQIKRLLKCARMYRSRDNALNVDDDERFDDEGYGSKTSSAEDKLNRDTDLGAWDVPCYDTDLDFKSLNSARKPAKFSYTHQNTTKSQLYGDSEDEDINTDRTEDSSATIKYYKTGYQDGSRDYISKLLERTLSQMGSHKNSNDLLRIRELKSTKMTLRKISIQDAKEPSCGQEQTIITSNNQNDFYDHQKTIVRSNSSLQTDRTQYPVYCTSPELKFNTNPQRPISKRNVRSIREEHSQRLAQTESLNRTRFPYLDFYRAHSSINLPLCDLLPAVDRSMKNKSGKTKQYVYENVPNITAVPETPRCHDKEPAKVSPEKNPPTLGGPPFKESSQSTEMNLTRQPTYLSDYYNNPNQWIRTQTAKLAEGSPQGVRLSGTTDKDAKKKLRDAFSRFYNTRSSMRNRDWAKDFKYIWNT